MRCCTTLCDDGSRPWRRLKNAKLAAVRIRALETALKLQGSARPTASRPAGGGHAGSAVARARAIYGVRTAERKDSGEGIRYTYPAHYGPASRARPFLAQSQASGVQCWHERHIQRAVTRSDLLDSPAPSTDSQCCYSRETGRMFFHLRLLPMHSASKDSPPCARTSGSGSAVIPANFSILKCSSFRET